MTSSSEKYRRGQLELAAIATFTIGMTFLLSASVYIPASLATEIPLTASTEIDGSNIINTPHHNSSNSVRNLPWVEIAEDAQLSIGEVCEQDAQCGYFSVCYLQVLEPEHTVKVCQCDSAEMIKVNNSCYIKPGHQCHFPHKNVHGYRFIPCLPGSVCKNSVNRTEPSAGYCMCSHVHPSPGLHIREVDTDFEMAHCGASLPSFTFGGFFLFVLICVQRRLSIVIQ